MADIKFMNLSENGNPATTDSVLIGNSQDGLKRTTLGAIGNMFSVHQALHLEAVRCNATTAESQITDPTATKWNAQYPIKAPEVPGYTFKIWVNSATNGFICGNYIDNPTSTSATVWLDQADVVSIHDSSSSITAVALYVKDELA